MSTSFCLLHESYSWKPTIRISLVQARKSVRWVAAGHCPHSLHLRCVKWGSSSVDATDVQPSEAWATQTLAPRHHPPLSYTPLTFALSAARHRPSAMRYTSCTLYTVNCAQPLSNSYPSIPLPSAIYDTNPNALQLQLVGGGT